MLFLIGSAKTERSVFFLLGIMLSRCNITVNVQSRLKNARRHSSYLTMRKSIVSWSGRFLRGRAARVLEAHQSYKLADCPACYGRDRNPK
jgi:hypothetical protein